RAIRSLWKGEPAPFEGKFFRWGPLESNPKPVQPKGVPIVVGGHTESAARRGDGFFPGVSDPEKLKAILATLRTECDRLGRKVGEIEITAGGAMDVEGIRRFEDLGGSRIAIPPPAFDPEGVRTGLHDFADRVISKL